MRRTPGGTEGAFADALQQDVDRLVKPNVEVAHAGDPGGNHEEVTAVDRRARLQERQEKATKEAIVVGGKLCKVGRRPRRLRRWKLRSRGRYGGIEMCTGGFGSVAD